MRKIINWTFGSVFRTFGRIIAYLIVGGLIGLILSQNHVKISDIFTLGIKKEFISVTAPIKMTSASHWAEDLPLLERVIIKDCTGTNTCNTNATSNEITAYYDSGKIRKFVSSDTLNIANNGIIMYVNSGLLKKGYMYGVNFYVCASNTINPSGSSFYISPVDFDSPGNKHNTFELFSSSELSPLPFGSPVSASCRKYESLIVPNNNYNWLGIRFKNIGSRVMAMISYEVNELGIYGDEIRSIVSEVVTANNSNLATSSQLNNATQEIQNEQQNTTNAIDNGFNQNCSNVFNQSTPGGSCSGCTSTNNSSGMTITCNSGSSVCYYNTSFSVTPNTTYNISFKSNKTGQHIYLGDSGGNALANFTSSGTFNTGSNSTITMSIEAFASNSPIKYYVIMISKDTGTYCEYGKTTNRLDETNQAINNVNDTLNDDDTTESSTTASNFFSNFNTNSHGLTGIITAPLNAIQSLTSKTCSPLVIPLPFMEDKNLTLPCMRPIYEEFFGGFISLYDIITLGIVSYWIMVRIFAMVKDFKNPDHDEIEVVDL